MSLIPRKFGSFFNERLNHNPIEEMQREMTRMMESFFQSTTNPDNNMKPTFVPRVDVSETNNEYHVHAELPGMTKENVDIQLSNNNLVIKGHKENQTEVNDKNYHRMERSYGTFQRTIPFTSEINPEGVKATFKNGVLEIDLAKTEETIKNTRKININ